MKGKYLPIGSIVNVNGISKKVMIVGYYSLEYNNSVKMFDYIGVSYPEGMLLKSTYSFNHSDVISIEFMGYPGEEYKVLNTSLLNQQMNYFDEKLQSSQNFVNLKFDENGVVVYDEISSTRKEPEIVKTTPIGNPFEVKEKATATGKKPVFTFDSNGVITEENISEDLEKIESNFKFAFDANGVIMDETNANGLPEKNVSKPTYKFDANGYVIADDTIENEKEMELPRPAFKFDANGVVIDDGTINSEKEIPSYHFDENGITINS